jgi:hypothetical protein
MISTTYLGPGASFQTPRGTQLGTHLRVSSRASRRCVSGLNVTSELQEGEFGQFAWASSMTVGFRPKDVGKL